jgi:hypothetical protein
MNINYYHINIRCPFRGCRCHWHPLATTSTRPYPTLQTSPLKQRICTDLVVTYRMWLILTSNKCCQWIRKLGSIKNRINWNSYDLVDFDPGTILLSVVFFWIGIVSIINRNLSYLLKNFLPFSGYCLLFFCSKVAIPNGCRQCWMNKNNGWIQNLI